MRKLNLKRLGIAASIPVGIVLIYIFGGLPHVYMGETTDSGIVRIAISFLSGIMIPLIIGAVITISIFVGMGIYHLFNWLFPKSQDDTH